MASPPLIFRNFVSKTRESAIADFRPVAVPHAVAVTLSSQVPEERLRVQANPAEFGTQIGAATRQAGDPPAIRETG